MLDPTQMIDDLIDDREGGDKYTNDPDDLGGPTKFGVTLRTLQEWRADLTLTADDVKNLTREEAEAIYRKKFWFNTQVCHLPDGIQPIAFDICVLEGQREEVAILQLAINRIGICAVAVDGKIGPKTIDAAEETCAEQQNPLIEEMVRQRCIHFDQLAITKPRQKKFLGGWKSRANSFLPAT